jgi:hypothetical protein
MTPEAEYSLERAKHQSSYTDLIKFSNITREMSEKYRGRLNTTEYHVEKKRDLNKAKTFLRQAQKFYKNGLHFDCLSKLEDSMLQVSEEPLSSELRSSN